MADAEQSPLQIALQAAIDSSGKTRDSFDTLYRQRTGSKGKPLFDIMRGSSRAPKPETLRTIAEVMGLDPEHFVAIAHPPRSGTQIKLTADDDNQQLPMVEIQHIDLAYGLGATFTDGPVDVELLKFPKVWVETITASPPALLTWTRARGDSMLGTINDGDLVLLDRSQRRVTEQDALWAFTVGDTGSIKRLRVKGDRMMILSDNPAVPPDEEPIDFVNIVARVVFIGRRA